MRLSLLLEIPPTVSVILIGVALIVGSLAVLLLVLRTREKDLPKIAKHLAKCFRLLRGS